ncbi:MAG TPA: hypothetical protein EYO59_06965 [Chromatiaceae bacterium]|jgi:hypothetical protein|nr:hypothetical protein [Chromatiaceae bacterium]
MMTLKTILARIVYHDKWRIGVVVANAADLLDKSEDLLGEIFWIDMPVDGYIADPFITQHEGEYYVFYEKFTYWTATGEIAYSKLEHVNGSWQASKPKTILDAPFHQSYPFIITHEGEIYCIPEHSESNRTILFKASHFPDQWEAVGTLVENFPLVDPTLVCHKDSWWLFGTQGGGQQDTHLYIWHAESLFGPWIPHRGNPVKQGSTDIRPAGSLFTCAGELYRPAQIIGARYGEGIVINKVTSLSQHEYAEQEVCRHIPSDSKICGLHHVSFSTDVMVIDGKTNAGVIEVFCKAYGVFARRIKTLFRNQELPVSFRRNGC